MYEYFQRSGYNYNKANNTMNRMHNAKDNKENTQDKLKNNINTYYKDRTMSYKEDNKKDYQENKNNDYVKKPDKKYSNNMYSYKEKNSEEYGYHNLQKQMDKQKDNINRIENNDYLDENTNRNTQKKEMKLQIPCMPILKSEDFSKITEYIIRSITDEATSAEFYSRLVKDAPDELHKEFIVHAMENKLEHINAFKELYEFLTGKSADYKINPIRYTTYKKGIEIALKDELEAAQFHRNVKLSTSDQLIKDTFFFAMVDELEHATQFGVLYNFL